jgi:hypothetical protein
MSLEVTAGKNFDDASTKRGCFHCGELCPDYSLALDGRNFCCFGCQTVFSLLRDKTILRNSEFLPADARLVRGEACVDYSFVTGESEPVLCAAGSPLRGRTSP